MLGAMIEVDAVAQFLQARFGLRILNVMLIGTSMFSLAFSFKLAEQEFVLRLNGHEEDFQKDMFAYQYFSAQVPVPRVVDCDRFDQNYYFVALSNLQCHPITNKYRYADSRLITIYVGSLTR
jgi:hypothetical protein